MKLYSLAKLHEEMKVSQDILRGWARKGWLIPDAYVGKYPRYSERSVMEAMKRSVEDRNTPKIQITKNEKPQLIDHKQIWRQLR